MFGSQIIIQAIMSGSLVSVGTFNWSVRPWRNIFGCEPRVPSGPGWCIRSDVYDAVSTGTGRNFEMNARSILNYPLVEVFNGDSELDNNARIDADIFFSKEDTAVVKRTLG